jgi:hypothetical protein
LLGGLTVNWKHRRASIFGREAEGRCVKSHFYRLVVGTPTFQYLRPRICAPASRVHRKHPPLLDDLHDGSAVDLEKGFRKIEDAAHGGERLLGHA